MMTVADIRNSEPVAYFYELSGVGKELVLDCNGEYACRLLEAGYTETPLYTRAAPPAMDREAVAKAIGDADAAFGYSCNLTRLVDGVATYTLTMTGYEPAEFDSIDDAHVVIAERRNVARADAIASTLSADATHPDNIAVERFAVLMKAKLAAARAKGRGGWDDPAQCSTDYLRTLLHEHVAKGDPVDVANFCMMLSHYGASTALSADAIRQGEGEALALRAIKAVTATAKDGAAGLSRIMAIASAAGVKQQYSELLQDPDVALIVDRPRTEWAHLFKPGVEGCAIPPEGWQCSRARGHSGPCAATSASHASDGVKSHG